MGRVIMCRDHGVWLDGLVKGVAMVRVTHAIKRVPLRIIVHPVLRAIKMMGRVLTYQARGACLDGGVQAV
jgi:hypothetical protein